MGFYFMFKALSVLISIILVCTYQAASKPNTCLVLLCDGMLGWQDKMCQSDIYQLYNNTTVQYSYDDYAHKWSADISSLLKDLNKQSFCSLGKEIYKFRAVNDDSTFCLTYQMSKKLPIDYPILLTNGRFTSIRPKFINTQLSDSLNNTLSKQTMEMFDTTCSLQMPTWLLREKNRYKVSVAQKAITTVKLGNVKRIIAEYKVVISFYNQDRFSGTDDRASALILIDPANDSILYKTFGHEEWSPDGPNLFQLEPLDYVAFKGRHFAICRFNYPWETYGYCLLDIEHGKILMETFNE